MPLTESSTSDHASRVVVPGHRVQLTGETARVGAPVQPLGSEPRIDLIRENNEVRAIDVTCPCGKRVRLQCVYDS
jgi:hypothetical protein